MTRWRAATTTAERFRSTSSTGGGERSVGCLGRSAPVLDVGSGTGIWSNAFAMWFGVRVVGVEPSSGMRAQAAAKRTHPSIDYVGGRADAIPVGGRSCAAAWLSTVVHHFRDLTAVAVGAAPGGPPRRAGADS